MRQCSLREANHRKLVALNCLFESCDLTDADLHGANLWRARFVDCVVSPATLASADFKDADVPAEWLKPDLERGEEEPASGSQEPEPPTVS